MHNDTPAAKAASGARSLADLVPGLALLALLVALIAPRGTPGLLVLLCAPIMAAAMPGMQRPRLGADRELLLALAAFGAYLFVNALWAVDPLEGLSRAALFALIVAAAFLIAVALPALSSERIGELDRAALLAVGLGAAFLAVEVALGQPIRRLVVNLLPFLRPPPKHVVMVDGAVTSIGLYTLNRNLALLNLMLWPAFLLLRARLPLGTAAVAAAALLAATALAVFRSEHETSMLALVVGCLVFAGMVLSARLTRGLILAGWVAATLLVVPLAAVSHDAGLHRASWLPGTARNRIVLWNVTAEKIKAAPFFGIGIGSTKPLDEEAAATAERREGDGYPQRTGRHAHNIFMQTWYELGGVGAVLLLLAGVAGIRALSRLAPDCQPYVFASFASATVLAAFTWGMWQPWFMSAFGIWIVVLLIGLDAARRGAPTAA